MKKFIYAGSIAAVIAVTILSCKKSDTSTSDTSVLSADEKALVASAGFNENWAEKRPGGSFLIEGDILLSPDQLHQMSGTITSHNLIVANDEHYRTYNLVTTPRTISVSIASGFPSYYYDALDNALNRYNSFNLKINFLRVATGGDIVISGKDLGKSGGGCILGMSAGFPSGGNPAAGFTLSTNSCATSYLYNLDRVDEVIAHEMGHCIGFRHTDYQKRSSCGHGAGESAGTIGAVHIDGTPTSVSGSYNSWMMACTNGSPSFSSADELALRVIYQ